MQRAASIVVSAVVGCNAVLLAQSATSDPKQVIEQYQAAYNKGDAKALGALFTENALRLGSDGRAFAGRAEIEQDAAAALSGPRKGSRAEIHVARTEVLKPDVALVEGTFEVTGVSTPVKGRYLITALRENGRWRIASIATAVPPTTSSR